MKDLLPQIIHEVDFVDSNVKLAQELAAARNQAIRAAERLAAYKAWVDPENMQQRLLELKEKEDEIKARSEMIKKLIRESLGLPEEDPPLPDPLPRGMRGQAESTIRAMLRQDNWEYDKETFKWRQK